MTYWIIELKYFSMKKFLILSEVLALLLLAVYEVLVFFCSDSNQIKFSMYQHRVCSDAVSFVTLCVHHVFFVLCCCFLSANHGWTDEMAKFTLLHFVSFFLAKRGIERGRTLANRTNQNSKKQIKTFFWRKQEISATTTRKKETVSSN